MYTDDFSGFICRYFDYLFYVDFEASMADVRAQNALGHLQVQLKIMMLQKV